MRLRHRMVLGLLTAALAVPAPANRWLLMYAGLALVVLVPRGPLLVQPVVKGQPAVDGQVLADHIARPDVAEQEQDDPGVCKLLKVRLTPGPCSEWNKITLAKGNGTNSLLVSKNVDGDSFIFFGFVHLVLWSCLCG